MDVCWTSVTARIAGSPEEEGARALEVMQGDWMAVEETDGEALALLKRTANSGAYDQAVSALIEDIYERGLDKRVLVVVTGEFGRTPKIEHSASTGEGVASAGTI